jgi:protein required for attachment to host cells
MSEELDFSGIDDRASDAPGRVKESFGHTRHAMEAPDLAAAARTRMAKAMARRLARAVDDGEVERFFIVAAPDTLGALRDELDERVRSRVVGELDKNLDNADVSAIADQLDRDGALGRVASKTRR